MARNQTPVSSFYAHNRAKWRQWLIENHQKTDAVWLIYDKGASRTMTWEDIVQEALCFGWIDSKPGKVSDTQSKLYVSRRKPKSVWSKINKVHIAELEKLNLLYPAGIEAVQLAKANGSWQALELSDNLVKPPILIQFLDQNKNVKIWYESQTDSKKRQILEKIYQAKTDKTRQKRLDELKNLIRISKTS